MSIRKFTERENGRTAIVHELPDLLRSHYDHMDRIAQDIRDLGRRLSNPPEPYLW
jgi:hypothetical protein